MIAEFAMFKLNMETQYPGNICFSRHLVGIVANNGEMVQKAALKGAHFVQLCTQRDVPIIFLQNSSPRPQPTSATETEEVNEKICAHAKLMSAVACSPVPKITVIVGNSIGADNFMLVGGSDATELRGSCDGCLGKINNITFTSIAQWLHSNFF